MKARQLLWILIVAVVCAAAAFLMPHLRARAFQDSRATAGGKVFRDFPLNDISKIVVTGTTNTVTLERKGGKWGVSARWGYPADFERVGEVLRAVWELKSVQKVLAGPSQMGRLELEVPGQGEGKATVVEFWKDGAKEPIKLLLGKRPENGNGRFVKAGGSDDVWLVSESFYRVSASPQEWMGRDLPEIGAAKTLSVIGSDGKVLWSLAREKDTDDFKLQNAQAGEEFDEATHGYTAKNPMSYATFSDVANSGTKPAESGMDKPRVAEIKTFDGFTYRIKIGAKDKENRFFASLGVNGAIAEKREPGKDEKDEDKKRLDEEFKKKQDELKKKLAAAKAHEKWLYKLDESRVSFFLKERADILKKKEEKKDAEKAADAPAADVKPEGSTPPAKQPE